MANTVKCTSRMDAIQAPIIAVIGDLIRQAPGTISLGQGVVHYGPPPAALEGGGRRCRDPEHARISATASGQPALIDAIEQKLPKRQRHRRRARQPRHGDGRRQHGLRPRGARDHAARTTKSSCRCRSTSITRWRSRWPAAGSLRSRPTTRYQLRSRRHPARRSPIARAPIVTISPNNPTGAVFPEAPAPRGQRALSRPRHLSHHR